jgi:multiple antibiotic resistance protein
MLSLGEVFVLLFVMLGPPLKVPAAFAARARLLQGPERRKLALQAFLLAVVLAIAGGGLGVFMMSKWQVEPQTVLLAGGILFLIVSLRAVLQDYGSPAPRPATPPPSPFELAFPTMVTPYGLAAIIVLFASSQSLARTAGIAVFVVAIILLDLLGMLFAEKLTSGVGPSALRLLGVVLGVMTVALALQMTLVALRELAIIPVATR